MRIRQLLWPRDRIEHIARHDVTPEEVEQACFGRPFVQRAKSRGENPVYYVLGQTVGGRYLFSVVIQFPDGKGISSHRPAHDRKRKAPISAMEGKMKTAEALPETDSIQKLAQFWDTHDLTDFEDELEEVAEPVFEHHTVIAVNLKSTEAEAVRRIAEAEGVPDVELIRGWVREKIGAS